MEIDQLIQQGVEQHKSELARRNSHIRHRIITKAKSVLKVDLPDPGEGDFVPLGNDITLTMCCLNKILMAHIGKDTTTVFDWADIGRLVVRNDPTRR